MNKNSIIFKAIILVFFLNASLQAQNLKYCGTSEATDKMLKEHPGLLQKAQILEDSSSLQASRKMDNTDATVYIIPVVFHILHDYGTENISDAQIADEMRILNEDFRNLNTDKSKTVKSFQAIAADCQIEFRLAKKDPKGNCTNGMDRIASGETYIGDEGSKINQWPRNKYLNIWVAKNITQVKGAAGYAFLPAYVPDPSVDGILIADDYVGSIGTSNRTNSRALTHEIGHFLNLYHPWGSSNSPGVACGDDYVTDTPTTKGWTSCNLTGSTCGALDNVQNYMEYSYCSVMFTEGQKARMRASLEAAIAERNNLWSALNLLATGTDGAVYPTCAPLADFAVSSPLICAGDSISFKDYSWNGLPTGWNWTFDGGTPANSILSSPVISYNTSGKYPVTLVARNSKGNSTKIKTSYISVLPSSAQYTSWMFFDSFENAPIPNADWNVNNSDHGITWQTILVPGRGNTAYINNLKNTYGAIDELISPTIDLAAISNATLSFNLAFAQIASSQDRLSVYVSVDCGKSWILKYNKSGSSLSTVLQQSPAFTPTSSQWRQESFSLSSVNAESNVLVKFKFVSDKGNNIYIDDVNISGPVGIDENSVNRDFSVSPNPVIDNAVISFSLSKKQKIDLSLVDLLGREVLKIFNDDLIAGEHQIIFNRQQIKSGIYFIKCSTENKNITRKIVID